LGEHQKARQHSLISFTHPLACSQQDLPKSTFFQSFPSKQLLINQDPGLYTAKAVSKTAKYTQNSYHF
jgi:hypothetical protein